MSFNPLLKTRIRQKFTLSNPVFFKTRILKRILPIVNRFWLFGFHCKQYNVHIPTNKQPRGKGKRSDHTVFASLGLRGRHTPP